MYPVRATRRPAARCELTDAEYPCWLLQTVLLQGYLYITQKHICFYAYLPKKTVGSPNDSTLEFGF